MRIEEFRKVIKERIECPDEWDYGVERCWKKEIEILSEDIPSTIEFLMTECTADEYSWISEVIEDLAAKNSKQRIGCMLQITDDEIPQRMREVLHRG